MSEKKLFEWRYFRHPVFLSEMFFYLATHLLAFAAVIGYLRKPVSQAEATGISLSPIVFLAVFFAASALLLLLVKKVPKAGFLRWFFYFALADGAYIFFQAFFDPLLALAFAAILLGAYFYLHTVLIHNVTLMIALAGIGTLLGGVFTPLSAIIVLLVLAVYDYWAVNRSKHMVTMFRGMAEQHAIFAMIIPYSPDDYVNSVRLLKINQNYLFLGTGDLVLPLMLAIPVFISDRAAGLMVVAGSAFGVLLLFVQYVTRQERRALPGLPPIVLGSILGYLISTLI